MFIVKKLSDNSKEFLNTYYDIVDNLNQQMGAVEAGKSISEIYIKQTIPYMDGGIKLNENILKYTTNVDVENFAKNTIFDQQNHLKTLNDILEKCQCVCNNERDIKLYMRKFNDILTGMINHLNSTPATNNIDVLFLNTMLIFYENGIAFARNVLSYSICPELKQLATDIIDENTLYIKTIKSILKNMM